LEKKLEFVPLSEDNGNSDFCKVKNNKMKTVTLKAGIED